MVKKIAYGLLFFILILCFIACSSTSKNKSSRSSKTTEESHSSKDTAAIKNVDSAAVKNTSSSSVVNTDSSQTKIETDTSSETITVNLYGKDSTKLRPKNDYEAAEWGIGDGGTTGNFGFYQNNNAPYTIEINGNKIKSNQPIKDVTIQNKKGKQIYDATKLLKKDSSTHIENNQVTVNKKDSSGQKSSADVKKTAVLEEKNKTVKRKSALAGWLIVISITTLFALFAWRMGWLKRLWLFFKPKNKH